MDLLLLSFALYVGYALRVTLIIPRQYLTGIVNVGVCFLLTVTVALFAGKIYKINWPQASAEEYARLFRWYGVGAAVFMLEIYVGDRFVLPRSSLIIMLLLGFLLLSGMRASWRLILISNKHSSVAAQRALIVGAGNAGVLIARDILRHESPIVPILFIDV